MNFIVPFGVLSNLFAVRSPLFEAYETEALPKQAIHIARNGSMVLHNARHYPIGYASTLKKIIIDRPNLGAVILGLPPRMTRGGEDGVLDRKDQVTARCQKAPYRRAHGPEIFYVM